MMGGSSWCHAGDGELDGLFVLPVGAFEQHGRHLPLATDSVIADAISRALADRVGGVAVPPVPVSCSHEHLSAGFAVAADARAVFTYLEAILLGAFRTGVRKVAIVNCHGGNYLLGNLVQQMNVDGPRVYLGPGRAVMEEAFLRAGIETSVSDDMHGGEYETSVMLACCPEAVRMEEAADVAARPRPLLNVLGMSEYTDSGIIGRPTLATKEKGVAVVDAIVDLMAAELASLWGSQFR